MDNRGQGIVFSLPVLLVILAVSIGGGAVIGRALFPIQASGCDCAPEITSAINQANDQCNLKKAEIACKADLRDQEREVTRLRKVNALFLDRIDELKTESKKTGELYESTTELLQKQITDLNKSIWYEIRDVNKGISTQITDVNRRIGDLNCKKK